MLRWTLPLVAVGTLMGAGAASQAGPEVSALVSTPRQTITFEGRLVNGGSPASGTFDMEFHLFTVAEGGTELASVGDTVTVVDGVFTADLPFATSLFVQNATFVEIRVRTSGGGAFTTLAPRLELTPAPYAHSALGLGCAGCVATTNIAGGAVTASRLSATGGVEGQVLALSGGALVWGTAIRGGTVASGDLAGTYPSPTVAALAGHPLSPGMTPSPGQALVWDGSAFTPAFPSPSYANVLVVAESGGDFTSIQAAIDSLPASPPQTVIYIAPGGYYEKVTLKPNVTLQGAGRNATVISASGSNASATGTVVGAALARLASLSVVNNGGASYSYATAVYYASSGVQMYLDDVNLSSFGSAYANGLSVANGGTVIARDSRIEASGTTQSRAVDCSAAAVQADRCELVASGSGSVNYGLFAYDAGASGKRATIRRSYLSAATAAVRARNSTVIEVTGTHFNAGGTTSDTGASVSCLASTVQSPWSFLPDTCP